EGHRLGWARVQLDTIPGGGFRIRSLVELETDPLGPSGSLRAETESRLGPELGLESFEARAGGSLLAALAGGALPPGTGGRSPEAAAPAPDTLARVPDTAAAAGGAEIRARGRVLEGDSTLVAVVERAGRRDSLRFPTGGDLVPLGALPLRLAADPRTAAGRRVSVRLLDPRSASVREVALEVTEAATRSYTDSARRKPDSGRWVPAGRDTVRAWRVTPAESGLPVTAWVDEDGRLLEVRLGSALRLERTAFELAYFPTDSVARRSGRGAGERGSPRGEGGGGP
ncbi:MAG: hypothetical protein ABEJ46_02155, partial [Gemmatimonadota bacterium]